MSVSSILSCEPCKYRGITSSAIKYCSTCQEHLCKECVDFHKSFKMTRGHLLVNTEDQQSLKLSLDMENLRMCKQHSNKSTEFYCWSHDTLLCSLCLLKSEQHRTCNKNIVEIESVGKSLIDGKLTDTAKIELRNMISRIQQVVKEMKEVKESSQKNTDLLKSDIEVIRRKLLEEFDRQTKSIVQKASDINMDIDDKYAKTIEKLEKEITKAEYNEQMFQTVLESGLTDDVFRCLMSILEEIEEIKTETEKYCEDVKKQEIVMVKSEFLKQLETNDKPLVHFNVKAKTVKLSKIVQNEQTKDYLKNQMLTVCEIEGGKVGSKSEKRPMFDTLASSSDELDSGKCNIEERVRIKSATEQTKARQEKTEKYELKLNHGFSFSVTTSDSKVPWFGGIACLPDERLVLSDFSNARLILLNDDNLILTTKTLDYDPGHITLLNANCLAVCLMRTNQILLTEIKKKTIKEIKYVQTKFHPKCVQPVKDKMLVSCQDINGGWYLSVITIQGEVCQQIKARGLLDGHRIAVQPLQSGQDEFRIIQCCEITNRLQCFEFDGSLTFDYGVDRVASVVTDANGYIFVIRYTGEIQVLGPDGEFLLKLYRQSLYKAKNASFNQAMTKLFITMFKDPKIHVLNVKRTKCH
ncbi:uncharacterized protein LOC123548075 [Mercenaria mercenaria]|uniref:uncharacterized protein LOC123548075 n=1 Tax=Mercenaria mercenaria TaxID=6596 RepID=UPI00234E3780|nr:uncharacterized protein LOC123548075 [Mercenaria mercenaria]